MNDLYIVIQLDDGTDGFTAGRGYDVLQMENEKLLVVDDEARFVWLATDQVTPVTIDRAGVRLFDLRAQQLRRKLERLAGKSVVLTTWENLGFDPDEISAENMFLYRGIIDHYDGETLFLRRFDGDGFSILPKIIATLEEAGK